MEKINLFKKIIIIFVIFFSVYFLIKYIFLSDTGKKSKAFDSSAVSLVYDPSSVTTETNKEFTLTAKVKANSGNAFIRGYSLKLVFDKTKLQLKKIEYKLGKASDNLGETDANLSEINEKGWVLIVGESNTANGQMVDTNGVEVVKLTFFKNADGGTTISSETSFYTVDLSDGVTIVENLITSPNSVDINGGGAIITSSLTPAASCNNSTNSCLNLKVKFQGINKKPAANQNTLPVKIKIVGCGLANPLELVANFTGDDNGVFTSSAGVNLDKDCSDALIYLKGPQHIQKKICDNTPTESQVGTYRCSNGKIALKKGANDLNFSGVVLLAGDLDQNGVTDSVDYGFIRNNLGKTDSQILQKGDLNRDGKVDTQDFSLILYALSVRTDEM